MNILKSKKEMFTPPDDLKTKVTPREVKRFMVDCIKTQGVEEPYAAQLAETLTAADMRGHYSHGLNRLELYVNKLIMKLIDGNQSPTVVKESVSTALVEGNNGLGPVVGAYCMNLAIKKAKETGVGWVTARGSNHYGIAGYYSLKASDQGLLGMSFSNGVPKLTATRAKKPSLGTNPISLAAPAKDEDAFVLDMATSTVAAGKIELYRRKELPLPQGWALDVDGQPTEDPVKAIPGSLTPLGGSEINSGFKGYGLAMMVEVLCGILGGGGYGPMVKGWTETKCAANLCHCFIAVDPSFFAPGFENRMSDLTNLSRNMEPADPSKPVLVAGDLERANINKVQDDGGITYHLNQIIDSWRLARVLNVSPMETRS